MVERVNDNNGGRLEDWKNCKAIFSLWLIKKFCEFFAYSLWLIAYNDKRQTTNYQLQTTNDWIATLRSQ